MAKIKGKADLRVQNDNWDKGYDLIFNKPLNKQASPSNNSSQDKSN